MPQIANASHCTLSGNIILMFHCLLVVPYRYCAAYDAKQNLLSAVEGGRMEDVFSIARESIAALMACTRGEEEEEEEEEEEVRCWRVKLDALLGKMCGPAHPTVPLVLTRAVSAPPSIQDDVIILSDSDDDENGSHRDEGWLLTVLLIATRLCSTVVRSVNLQLRTVEPV